MEKSVYTLGHRRGAGSGARMPRIRSMFAASRRKSSSRLERLGQVLDDRRRDRRSGAAPGRAAVLRANTPSSPRSRVISSRAPGRCTFTTTRSPVASVARCTCAIDPVASGSGSMLSNTSSHGTPQLLLHHLDDLRLGERRAPGRAASASSSMNSGGTRSGRVERIWPSLQNVGPSSSNASRSRRALSRVSVPSVVALAPRRTAPRTRASRRRWRSWRRAR